ncbi:MAG: ABC transporter ATP-binding protein [Gemmatimonadaceae bacterium]
MLDIASLVVDYGPVRALHGISLRVPDGSVVAVIGSNGAGKTTTLRAVSGLVRVVSGTIALDSIAVGGRRAHEVTRLGVAHVPEGRHVFPDQSVMDNLMLGAFSRRGPERTGIDDDIRDIFNLFPRLKERRRQMAGTLSGGEQQMLAIGRALMLRPKLMLLDEPSMGLAPVIIDEVFKRLAELKGRGMTMLLVEQLAYRALGLADYAYVIEHGRIEIEGSAAALKADPRVRAAYLGEGAGV